MLDKVKKNYYFYFNLCVEIYISSLIIKDSKMNKRIEFK